MACHEAPAALTAARMQMAGSERNQRGAQDNRWWFGVGCRKAQEESRQETATWDRVAPSRLRLRNVSICSIRHPVPDKLARHIIFLELFHSYKPAGRGIQGSVAMNWGERGRPTVLRKSKVKEWRQGGPQAGRPWP